MNSNSKIFFGITLFTSFLLFTPVLIASHHQKKKDQINKLKTKFEEETKHLTQKTSDGTEYIPLEQADSLFNLQDYYKDVQENRKIVTEKETTTHQITTVGYSY